MKKLITAGIVTVLSMGLSGCSWFQPAEPKAESQLQTFVNNTYGYSIELPKTWGAIQTFGGSFTPELYDDLEEIGPNLPTAFDENDRDQYFLSIEIFSDENSKRNPNESWLDFYTRFRLDEINYDIQKWDDTTAEVTLLGKSGEICQQVKVPNPDPTDTSGLTFFESKCFDSNNDTEFYKRTCRLIEHGAKFYSFCYNNGNNVHSDIMKSLKFFML